MVSGGQAFCDIDHGDRKSLIGAAPVSHPPDRVGVDHGQSITVWREVCGGEPPRVSRRVTPLARCPGHWWHRRAGKSPRALAGVQALRCAPTPLRGAPALTPVPRTLVQIGP